ncbi:Abi family protein [Nocardia sp. NPDC059228]|uniref:Abi family protein n=1 Tax=Nocardia sp. NPDC059228 TaxID=3346777 RepID=UPI003688321F
MKPFLSIEDQVQRLRDNGLALTATESAEAVRFLKDHNYYRLSGYFRYFQVNPPTGQNQFTAGATFQKIQAAYSFDRRLTERLQSGLADFEIVFRSQLAYLIAQSTGPDSYLDDDIYEDRNGARDKLLQSIDSELKRSTERFVQHHRARGEAIPVWAAVEALSLGTSSKMYGLIKDADGVFKPLATRFGISHKIARKTFRAMSVLRNVCAHHGRIWNRSHGIEVEAPRVVWTENDRTLYKDTPWAWAVTLGHLVDNARGDDCYSQTFWDFIEGEPAWLCQGLTHPSQM